MKRWKVRKKYRFSEKALALKMDRLEQKINWENCGEAFRIEMYVCEFGNMIGYVKEKELQGLNLCEDGEFIRFICLFTKLRKWFFGKLKWILFVR